MNQIATIITHFHQQLGAHYNLETHATAAITTAINTTKGAQFGDISSNAAMVLAKKLGTNPRTLAQEIVNLLAPDEVLAPYIAKIEIAGPGFLNFFGTPQLWLTVARGAQEKPEQFFGAQSVQSPKKYLLEIVSANPTGPLHLGHGRGGIIGDVFGRILTFLGHEVTLEYYINDAGSQIDKLGGSLQARVLQELGQTVALPENGYAGEYLVEIAKQCVAKYGDMLQDKSVDFFATYAKDALLERIKETLAEYRITFDAWFSEKTLHESGAIDEAIGILQEKELAYEKDGALWFAATKFGDDKDRVIRKTDGQLTYIAADIAYHKNKFDRGYDVLIDIFGQDHHGYVKRLIATMEALGYPAQQLQVILYQLVTIKQGEQALRMSKRKGTFTRLDEIIDEVGVDVARFFYLNRKAEAHLEFDLDQALAKSEENPAYYVQYAYVRCASVLNKARTELSGDTYTITDEHTSSIKNDEIELLKVIASLGELLPAIASNQQTHLLAYYSIELARAFHGYYARNRIIDPEEVSKSALRCSLVDITQRTLGLCLDLLGLSKPEKM